jgi:hypothetical protein
MSWSKKVSKSVYLSFTGGWQDSSAFSKSLVVRVSSCLSNTGNRRRTRRISGSEEGSLSANLSGGKYESGSMRSSRASAGFGVISVSSVFRESFRNSFSSELGVSGFFGVSYEISRTKRIRHTRRMSRSIELSETGELSYSGEGSSSVSFSMSSAVSDTAEMSLTNKIRRTRRISESESMRESVRLNFTREWKASLWMKGSGSFEASGPRDCTRPMSLGEKHSAPSELSKAGGISYDQYSGDESERAAVRSSFTFTSGKPTSTPSSKELGVVETDEVSEGFADRGDSKSESNDNSWGLIEVSIVMVIFICIFVTLLFMEVRLANRDRYDSESEE